MKNNLLIKIQKILCYVFLIASAGVLVCSLLYVAGSWIQFSVGGLQYESATSFYDNIATWSKSLEIEAFSNGCYSKVFNSDLEARKFYYEFWYEIQGVNNMLFALGIVGLVTTAIFAITGNFGRKKYYISNLVTGCLAGGCGIILSIITIIKTFLLRSDFNFIKPDIENFYVVAKAFGKHTDVITANNTWISIIVPIIYILICGSLIAFTIYKFVLSSKKEAAINE